MILDVAHNVEAAAVLAENLGDSGFAPETIAVFGMLRDKDIAGVLRALAPRITRWHLASLPGPRGAVAREDLAATSQTRRSAKHDSRGAKRSRRRKSARARVIRSSCSAPSSPSAKRWHG